jgi:hypothetical protein
MGIVVLAQTFDRPQLTARVRMRPLVHWSGNATSPSQLLTGRNAAVAGINPIAI